MTPTPVPVDEVQRYIATGVVVLPTLKAQFLRELKERERTQRDVCLAPSAILELYHIELYNRVCHRLQYRERRAA